MALLMPALVLLGGGATGQTPGDITVEPAMVKGPAAAPVTIVEFSDYQ